MKPMSLSRVVVSPEGDPKGYAERNRLITFSQAAYFTQTSVTILERFADLGLIEPIGSMLRTSDLTRVIQIMRLRRDLGLNLMGRRSLWNLQPKLPSLKPKSELYNSSNCN